MVCNIAAACALQQSDLVRAIELPLLLLPLRLGRVFVSKAVVAQLVEMLILLEMVPPSCFEITALNLHL